MTIDPDRHPCFRPDAKGRFARVHLPVAPACNIQCNYCNRKHDCLNESRPGVTSRVLTPAQAVGYLAQAVEKDPRVAVAGIAGPGDALATPELTIETCRLVRRRMPEMLLCVASNGLNVAESADALAELDVSHVTLTINGVDPEITRSIYAWVRHRKRVYRGLDAAKCLLENQLAAIDALKRRDVIVKVNTIVIPGYNDAHVEVVAKTLAPLGVDLHNCMPICPVDETPFCAVAAPDCETIERLRARAGEHLPQMAHCTRCRADAAGMLGEDWTDWTAAELDRASRGADDADRPYVAVASREGLLVNEHLGEATEWIVFAPDENSPGGFQAREVRPAPPPGGGLARWEALARTLHDCRAVLAAGAGNPPREVLSRHGIRTVLAEGLIDEYLPDVHAGKEVRSPVRCDKGCAKDTGECSGDGTGCG